jgi:hypothetical protein
MQINQAHKAPFCGRKMAAQEIGILKKAHLYPAQTPNLNPLDK